MADEVRDKLIERLTLRMQGEAFPLNDDSNRDDESLYEWIKDAVGKINRQRRKTTRKSYALALVTDQNTYALPTDMGTIVKLIEVTPDREPGVLGPDFVPLLGPGGAGAVPYGVLPNGQQFTPGLDMIRRQAMTRRDRTTIMSGRLEEGYLVLDQPCMTGVTLRVYVDVEDEDVELLPRRHHDLVITFLRWKLSDAHLSRLAGRQVVGNDGAGDVASITLRTIATDLEERWKSELAAIGVEAN